MIVSLVVHMFSTMMLKAYRPPRELTWVTGFILFSLALGFGFSGYLCRGTSWRSSPLPSARTRSSPCRSSATGCLQVMRGGPDVTINTLYRFFALHICNPADPHRRGDRWPPDLHPASGHGAPDRSQQGAARHEVLSEFRAARSADVADRLVCAVGAGAVAALRRGHSRRRVGAGAESGSAGTGLPGNQAGVVLPLDLSAPQGISASPAGIGGAASLPAARERSYWSSGRSSRGSIERPGAARTRPRSATSAWARSSSSRFSP